MLSSLWYNTLPSTVVLQLPSERTLRDYMHVKIWTAKQSRQAAVKGGQQKIPEHQKYVSLILDDKEDLVYNKHSGEFIDITNVNNHLEQSCTGEAIKPQRATHMLVFMIRGLFSSLEFPYTQFPVATASEEVLFPIV